MKGQRETIASWWLSNIPDWGAVRIRQLLQILGSAGQVYETVSQAVKGHVSPEAFGAELYKLAVSRSLQGEPAEWEEPIEKSSVWRITKENIAALMAAVPAYESSGEACRRWLQQGGGFVTCEEEAYPGRLTPFRDRPFALYYLGNLPEESRGTAAVIGARACSQYGRRYARSYARELAANGIQIVSGLAYGIDSEGHLGALEAGMKGSTYAILGCGADICYPREQEGIYRRILEQGGGILSEYAPGVKPLPWHFPMRNRIISGLSDCVLVMEARKKSGSLITVDLALEQGKEIFALPGRVGDALSEGCLQLIRSGAGVLTDCREVMDFCQGTWNRQKGDVKRQEGEKQKEAEKNGEEKDGRKADRRGEDGKEEEGEKGAMKRILAAIDSGEQNLDGLVMRTGLPLITVQENVLELLLEGRIEELSVGYYARKNLRP